MIVSSPKPPARLDYARAFSAELLAEIAGLIGSGAALKFARRFGGRRLYVPRRVRAGHPIEDCVGAEAAKVLAKELGGQAFNVPGARNYLRWLDVRALRLLGLSHAAIAERVGVHDRHVRRLLRAFRPEEYEIDETVRSIGRFYGLPGSARGNRDPAADRPASPSRW
jgi:hypothetical protein